MRRSKRQARGARGDHRRLQRDLGRLDAGDATRGLRDRGDEPVALVVAAQELGLLPLATDEQQQVAVRGRDVDDLGLGALAATGERELEPERVVDIDARSAEPRALGDAQGRTDRREATLEQLNF